MSFQWSRRESSHGFDTLDLPLDRVHRTPINTSAAFGLNRDREKVCGYLRHCVNHRVMEFVVLKGDYFLVRFRLMLTDAPNAHESGLKYQVVMNLYQGFHITTSLPMRQQNVMVYIRLCLLHDFLRTSLD